ncbi:recombinase family protein [Siccirubricoccus sp. KC 17139]|uniref:Recombinase family protein n=1 Tax=Siccirubricoccus soli TaxID=2899147 RepID=A0ABT1D1D2_9PROT|nr:recombinase family protein [Siccirubricoccus soli]MCP2681824.1 recombinase family protein [Siccirubricoccus soli]
MTAYGYVRSDWPEGYQPETEQRAEICLAAAQAGVALTEIFEDNAWCRARLMRSRPGGKALFAKIAAGDTLFVASLLQLSRRPLDVLNLLLMLKRKAIALVVTNIGPQPITGQDEMPVVTTLLTAAATLSPHRGGERGLGVEHHPQSSSIARLQEIAIDIERHLGFWPGNAQPWMVHYAESHTVIANDAGGSGAELNDPA